MSMYSSSFQEGGSQLRRQKVHHSDNIETQIYKVSTCTKRISTELCLGMASNKLEY